jgi:uncharacterized protein YggT (Ycf19 family)
MGFIIIIVVVAVLAVVVIILSFHTIYAEKDVDKLIIKLVDPVGK